MNKGSFKSLFSFEFWQKFGKALMVVIAVMPAAGLMISIGKSIPMINPNLSPLVITGGILEQIGWGVIGNLHILFALAIGGSWAKERAGGAFAAGLSFIQDLEELLTFAQATKIMFMYSLTMFFLDRICLNKTKKDP